MRFNIVRGGEFYRPLAAFLKDLPKDYIGTLAKVRDHHGALVQWQMFGGALNFAFINDAGVNRELFVRNTDALGKSPSQLQTFLYAAGQTVATAHGQDWRTKRKEANTLFSRSVIEASCAGQFAVVQDYIQTLGRAPQDAMLLARRMAALTSSRGILGRAITLEEADAQIAFSRAAADRFNAESAHLFARPDWMLMPWRKELTRQKEAVFPIMRKAIHALRSSKASNDGLMNHYVNGDFITSNDDEVLSILVGLLMGAQDNIAAITAWILAYLAHHPDLQDQLRNALNKTRSEAADLNSCKLLRATVCEVLRLRPPAPANQPRYLKRSVEIAGTTLPKGTHIFNSFYNMHHNPAVFNEPDAFQPTRFLDGTLERSLSFTPFGHGPRNCVAQGMAMQQSMAIVVAFLRKSQVVAQHQDFPEIQQNPFLVPTPFEVAIEPY